VIKVWDIKEHTLLQNVILQFPSSLHARMPDHGPFPLHLQPSPHDALLVTCNDYVGMLKLGRVEPPADNTMALTHETQLCSAIYNNFFKQICVLTCIKSPQSKTDDADKTSICDN
jgi:hypothetical protein